jgi:hypothetical protein
MQMFKLPLSLPDDIDFKNASWEDIDAWLKSMDGLMTPDQIAELREDIKKIKQEIAEGADQE